MTARQKKQLQNKQMSEKDKESDEVPEEVVRPKKTGLIVSILAGALAIVLIVFAICLPIITSNETITDDTFLKWKTFNPKDPDHPYDSDNPNPAPPANPTVTFTLTGDDMAAFTDYFGSSEVSLRFELFMDDAPYSSINMLYLAESGFYDDTIINDIKNGHAMINGFTKAVDKENKAFKVDFIEKLTGFQEKRVSQVNNSDFKLGYRLYPETVRETDDSFGNLIMLAGSSSSGGCSSTAYVFVTRDNSPQFDDLMTSQSNMSWMGRIADEGAEQYEILEKINSVPTKSSGKFKVPEFNIKIKTAKTDLSRAQKNYLLKNFERIMSNGIYTTWRNYSYNASDYKF